ncbi:MAG: acetyl-CoA carboxylase biotin carboxyl carrier protein [Planctomycetes bacterium]|nr:acetyl-CoA carboxylase biotin carboxyl carrier protein [Planctomycetota bacterium]
MDLDKIREMIALMEEHDLTEIEISSGEEKIRLKKGEGPLVQRMANPGPVVPQQVVEMSAQTAESEEESGLIEITSPMVGTFYRANAPDAEPYAEVGDMVEADDVVCIIEAMKVMNEIKAEIAGEVVDILVENGDVIEYGQPLFKIKPKEPDAAKLQAKGKGNGAKAPHAAMR